MMFMKCFILLLMLVACSIVVQASIIQNKVENTTLSFPTYWHIKTKKLVGPKMSILFPGSTNPKNLSTCGSLNPKEFGPNFSFNGTTILLLSFNGCSYVRHAQIAQDQGASAVILAAGIPYITATAKDNWDLIKIPVFFISYKDAVKVAQTVVKNAAKRLPTLIQLQADNNLFLNVGKGGFWIFLETIILLSYAFNFVLGIRSMVLHLMKEGLKPNISQLTIWVNLMGTFICSMVIFDPWNVRYFASIEFVLILVSLYVPALLSSVLLLSFFFNEVLIAKGFMKPQLSTMKIPFLVVCFACWGAYIANAVYFTTYQTNVDCIKVVVLMNVLFFSLADIYYISVAILIVIRLKNFDSPVLKRLIPLIVSIAFGNILFVIGSIIDATQVFDVNDPRKTLVVWSLYYISSVFIFTPQFIYFRRPTSKSSMTPKTNSTNKPASNKMVQLDEK